MSERSRVLLYIAADDPRESDVAAWLRRLEDTGLEIARATGHEAGRVALQTGGVSFLVLDQALGRTSCMFLLREGRAHNDLEATLVLREGTDDSDDIALIDAGASCIFSRSNLMSLDIDALLPMTRDAVLSSASDSRAFMSRISHEIRTPLHGIHGAVDLLEGTGLTPLQRDYIQIVRNAANALMSVVNDLVDYANPRAQRMADTAFPFELRTCAERVAAVVGPKAMAKGIEFVHLVHCNVPWRVKGNPNALRQILSGLSGHLIRHSGHGAVIMEMEAAETSEVAATLRFRVGVERGEAGWALADLPEPGPGPGDEDDVSLERCSELVRELGGELQSRAASSGTMQFEFSAVFNALPDRLPLAEIGMEALQGREVLVVDDTATNRVVYREQLGSLGCEVVEVSDGKEALEAISAQNARGACFDIALIDFAMPEMDGEALARAIRAIPGGEVIRLVLCTSAPQGGDAARMLDAGFDAYLTKPLRFDCLRKVMCLLLGSRASERERASLITQHLVDEMDRAARSILYVGSSSHSGRDALAALQRHGFPCDTARFGDGVADAMASNRYGSVLVDCRGSLDEGIAQAAQIRATQGGERIPLLMILRRADTEEQTECLAAGGDAVLVEPIQRDELVSMMRAYLGLEEPESFDEASGDWDMGTPMTDDEGIKVPPIDMEWLEEITAGDAELRQELVDMFLDDTEKRFGTLEAAIAGRDGERLNRTAHSLKGSCANMGAPTLQALAHKLETAGLENRFEEAPGLIAELKNEFDVVKVFFGTL